MTHGTTPPYDWYDDLRPETNEEDGFSIMDKALEAGINFFDTANVYGWKKGEVIPACRA